jgi:3-oxoacyl-(acyl-carrier-protein) synthase
MSSWNSVVLTGLGALTARGDDTLHATQSTIQSTPDASFALPDFQLSRYLDSKKTYLDRCSALALAGCALALRDAGVLWPPPEEEFGITLGTHLGCIETMKSFWDKATERGVHLAPPLLFSHSYFNSPISLCAIEFGLKGYHTTICAGRESGLEAVRAACDAIRLGHAEAMLCGGVEAYTPARAACEPVENMGEAAVFFVLETPARAAARGAEYSVPLGDGIWDAALQQRAGVRATFGDCGGAEGALCLLRQVQSTTRPAP